MRKGIYIAIAIGLIVAVAFNWYRSQWDRVVPHDPSDERTFDTNDPIQRACDLPPTQLLRLWRGHDPVHSEDVTTVPLPPNYSGAFGTTSHSGPWDYVQTIPLVLYGPNHIVRGGPLDEAASITDVFPTVGALTNTKLPERDGDVLQAIEPNQRPPKLIFTLVWDGVGRNVLNEWPDKWPNLQRLENEGTSYLKATVGSSPSITPATHSSLGTGAFPNEHGVTAIEFREKSGKVRGAFNDRNPNDLKLTTYGDEIDKALNNEPKVGMAAWKSWHLGMLGHGSAGEGGDKDQLAMIGSNESVTGNPLYYETPSYLAHFPGLQDHADEVDKADGKADGQWLGHDVLKMHDNPAWVEYETDVILAMLEREGYGDDAIPDLFFTNYKMTDIVSHQYGIDSPEEGGVLEAQDAALGRIVDYLDKEVGDYAIVITADHGNTYPAAVTGGWPILQGQLQADVDAEFDAPQGESLINTTSAAGPFLDRPLMEELGVTEDDVARFLNGYTIADNANEPNLPEGYEGRGDENVFSAVFASGQYDEVMECAFGAKQPPSELNG